MQQESVFSPPTLSMLFHLNIHYLRNSSMLLLLASVSMSGGGMALRQSLFDEINFSKTLKALSGWGIRSDGMLHWSSSQGWQYELSLFYVGLPGEIDELLVAPPEPVLRQLVAHHPLVTPPHYLRHGYWKYLTISCRKNWSIWKKNAKYGHFILLALFVDLLISQYDSLE